MTPKIVIVGGLPGSGKTPYLKQLSSEGWEVFDDFQANARDNSPEFRNARHYARLILALRAGRRCVVSDIRFVCPGDRQEAERVLRDELPNVAIDWRFFEPDREQCEDNILRASASGRRSKARLAKLEEFSQKYSVPSDAVQMPVWRENP